jgi:hypothetical protein
MNPERVDWEAGGAAAEPAPQGDDPVVAEVRAAREALFAEAGFDLEALGRLLRERQAAAGRSGVVLPPRAPDASPQAA